jgi:prolyl-tRNA editing enzyme YbaK/EbsC (Cys-tRNA(Pro) deacylase)
MLEDFIESNKLKSRIIDYPTETSMDLIAAKNFFPKNQLVKTQLFITKKNELFLTIIQFHSEIDFKKLKALLNEDEFLEADESECLDITGYKKSFLPPISIYGVTILIDNSLKEKNSIISKVSEKQVLETKLEELISFNEDVLFADLIL